MKKLTSAVLVVILLTSGLLAGCGTSQTGQEVSLTDFDKVEISNGFHVDISVGEEYSVTLKVDEDILDDVEAVKEGDTLKIRTKPLHDFDRGVSLNAEVSMPSLTGLTIKSGSHVTASGSGRDVTFNISGGSHASLGGFAVENADLTVIGGSHVTVNVGGRLDVKVGGGSHVSYKGEPQIGNVDISGGSTFKEQ